jgi:hypothetical protein
LGCGVRGSMTWVIHFGGVDLTFNFWCWDWEALPVYEVSLGRNHLFIG